MLKTLLTLFFVVSMVSTSLAAVTLSVTPLDGSNSLRLDNVTAGLNNRKEIRVQVASTDGNRYQVFQRLVEPLINEKGMALDSQAIETASYNNTNSSGTLYLQNVERVNLSEQHLYSSGQGGDSDSFIMGYSIRPDQVVEGGHYTGRLVFIVRAVGSDAQDQVIVNVSLESQSVRVIKVAGAHVDDRVTIKDTDNYKTLTDYVKVAFSGNDRDIRIYQEFSSWPKNVRGDELGQGLLQFNVSSLSTDNAMDQGAVVAGLDRVLIYSGSARANEIAVAWVIDPEKVKGQDTGSYEGKLKYVVESSDGREEFFVNLECIIQPVFTITVDVPPGGVNFGKILPNSPAQEKSVDVIVNSNLKKPYQVVQGLQAAMTNQKGEQINNKYLMMKVELPAGQKGQPRFTEFTPVETAEYPVFLSDAQGSPVSFKVIYSLQGYPGVMPGDFLAPVRFSLQEN